MKPIFWIISAIVLLLVIAIIVSANINNRIQQQVQPRPIDTVTSSIAEVVINNSVYSPGSLTVQKNSTVVFINNDKIQHTVTGPTFNSGLMNPGTVFSQTFDAEGTYEYYCTVHNERGKIIVQ